MQLQLDSCTSFGASAFAAPMGMIMTERGNWCLEAEEQRPQNLYSTKLTKPKYHFKVANFRLVFFPDERKFNPSPDCQKRITWNTRREKKVICNAEIYLKLKKTGRKAVNLDWNFTFFSSPKTFSTNASEKLFSLATASTTVKKNTTHALHGFHVATANERGRLEAKKILHHHKKKERKENIRTGKPTKQ